MIQGRLAQGLSFFKIIGTRFVKDRFTYSASALTYTTLLAIVPLMAVGLTILSAFPVFGDIKTQMQGFIFSNFVPAKGEVVQQYLSSFAGQASKLSVVGTIFLVITAVLTMLTIERALNDIWHVQERRRGVSAWLRYWAILSLGPVFAGMSLAATTYVVSMPFIKGAAASIGAEHLLAASLPFGLSVIGLTLLYTVVPNCRVPWRYGLLGAVVASILFEIVKKLFIFYVTGFNTYELLYGALATVPILLLWIYLSWVIVLFGALVSNVFATTYFSRCGGRIDGFMHAVMWLKSLWSAQQQGESLSLSQLFHQTPGYYMVHPDRMLAELQKLNLVSLSQSGRYLLVRDLSSLSLAELYRLLPWRLPSKRSAAKAGPKFESLIVKLQDEVDEYLGVPLSELFRDEC